MKWKCRGNVTQYSVSILALLVVATLGAWFLGMKSADIAAWVQAFGSIGAIVFASLHVSHQMQAAERLAERQRAQSKYDKLSSIFPIAAAAREHVDIVAEALEEAPNGSRFNGLMLYYDARLLDICAQALAVVPLHELESGRMVEGIIDLQLAVRSAQAVLADSESASERDPDDYIQAARDMRSKAESAIERIKRALHENAML